MVYLTGRYNRYSNIFIGIKIVMNIMKFLIMINVL